MDISILDRKIKEGKLDEAMEEINRIGKDKNEDMITFLIKNLRTTTNHNLRNTIAIALSDIGSSDAIKPILELLQDNKTTNNRGTLLYALEGFDYSMHLDFIASLLFEDNFEVSRHSLILIDSIEYKIPDSIKQKCISSIKEEIERLNEKIEFLSEALNILENK